MTPEEKPESDPKPVDQWKRSPDIAGLPPFHPFVPDVPNADPQTEQKPETQWKRSPVLREPGT